MNRPQLQGYILFAEWNCIGSNAVRQLCTSSQFLLPFFSGGNEWLSVVLLIVWTESFCCLWRIILNGWFTVRCTVKCLIFCLCSVGLLYFHIISMVKRAHGDNNIQRHVLVRHAYRANCAIVNRNSAAWTTIKQYFSSNFQTWFSYFWLWKDICLSCLLVVTSHFLLMLVISKWKLFILLLTSSQSPHWAKSPSIWTSFWHTQLNMYCTINMSDEWRLFLKTRPSVLQHDTFSQSCQLWLTSDPFNEMSSGMCVSGRRQEMASLITVLKLKMLLLLQIPHFV